MPKIAFTLALDLVLSLTECQKKKHCCDYDSRILLAKAMAEKILINY